MAKSDAAARLEALDAVFAALDHAARRQILLTIHFRGGEMSAGDIAGRFACAWPTTTRHVRVLERAGLLMQERRGRQRVYRVDRARLSLVREWLVWFDAPGGSDEAKERKSTGRGGAPRVRARAARRV